MENTTFLYKCGHCDAAGIVFVKSDDETVRDGLFCPVCATPIEYGDYEADSLLSEDVIEELDDSTKDFLIIKS